MAEQDIVAEMDRWIAQQGSHAPLYSPAIQLLQAARNEIVALREERSGWRTLHHNARNQALEEAAFVCDEQMGCLACAEAIRKLIA